MTETKEIITFTKTAKNRIKEIITKAKKNYVGIRIGIDNSGCSGHSYKIDYAENKVDGDEVISVDNIKVLVTKAKGKKCSRCWKILENVCQRNNCGLKK